MKKLLIIGLLLTILLGGCGLYNLTHFVVPDDTEFIAIVASLDTPQKICDYLEENFTFKLSLYYAPSPYVFWLEKEGDCNDFADFGMWVANQNGWETYSVIIYFGGFSSHALTIYVEDSLYNYQNVKKYKTIQVNTFREVVEHWQSITTKYEWRTYRIYDYDDNLIERGVR